MNRARKMVLWAQKVDSILPLFHLIQIKDLLTVISYKVISNKIDCTYIFSFFINVTESSLTIRLNIDEQFS